MSKTEAKPKTTAKPEAQSHAGKVKGIQVTDSAFRFTLEGKKGKLHELSLELKAAHMITTVLAAHTAGKKLHIEISASGATTCLQLGDMPKPKIKVKKPKVEVAAKAETPAPAPAANTN